MHNQNRRALTSVILALGDYVRGCVQRANKDEHSDAKCFRVHFSSFSPTTTAIRDAMRAEERTRDRPTDQLLEDAARALHRRGTSLAGRPLAALAGVEPVSLRVQDQAGERGLRDWRGDDPQ